MHPPGLEFDLLSKLLFDFLLHFILNNAFAPLRFLHALGVPLAAIVRHHAFESAGLDLTSDKLFDKGYINTYSVGDPAGANFMGVKLRDNMNPLLP